MQCFIQQLFCFCLFFCLFFLLLKNACQQGEENYGKREWGSHSAKCLYPSVWCFLSFCGNKNDPVPYFHCCRCFFFVLFCSPQPVSKPVLRVCQHCLAGCSAHWTMCRHRCMHTHKQTHLKDTHKGVAQPPNSLWTHMPCHQHLWGKRNM